MPIYVYLDVDIDACRDCATALRTLGESAEGGFERFRDARDRSEDVWKSDAGESFRGTISTLSTAAERTADRAEALAKALDSFAGSMLTARQSLTRAVARAMEAGIWVGPNVCKATWIGDPDPLHPTGPWSIEQLTTQANQIAAYNDAVDMVIEARTTETNAHTALQAAFEDSAEWLDRLRSSAPWMAVGGVISYLGTAAQQADQWGAIAQTRAAQLERFAALAAEAAPDSVSTAATRVTSAFTPAADDAIRVAAQNRALLPGSMLPKLGELTSKGLPLAGGIGSKIPVAGALFTGGQIVYDLHGAEDLGDAAKVVGKDAGGFLAGTAATTLLLGSVAGGPATVAAVGVGILVGYGVGELIEWAAE
ncbi:putative uncharacterized protein [Rhodococcus sp. AW25M09]|uniref:WXG100 family type VII secretion target n=1 Tax=Rhodococcus sp. AW25M09 TaxID=1268303 RepID=UPI0002AC8B8B|nr:hypothetical protein [Rhodococcus sp. AW25M09]CCQ15577.1 putative uncharacterized protein [Rhodococcus sp. AW25M09]